MVEVSREQSGAPGVINLEKRLRKRLEKTLLKTLQKVDAAILISCDDHWYWLIK